jgi:hypothetical protein
MSVGTTLYGTERCSFLPRLAVGFVFILSLLVSLICHQGTQPVPVRHDHTVPNLTLIRVIFDLWEVLSRARSHMTLIKVTFFMSQSVSGN